jgi:cysteine desulfurase/selenocysteine lyase
MKSLESRRGDFPIFDQKRGGKGLVYLDSSSTSQKPQVVIDAMKEMYETCNANIHRGLYYLSEEATRKYKESKDSVADFIHASTYEEIVYTRNTTESINAVALMLEKEIHEGDEILITMMEHHSNLLPWQQLAKRRHAKLVFVTLTKDAEIDMKDFNSKLNEKTKVVAVAHVSNVLGTINPAKEIIAKAKKFGAYTLIDGAQAVSHIPVDVLDLDCDFYAFSGHKMFGPMGIGVLYAKKQLLEHFDPIFYGGEMVSHVEKETLQYNDLPWKFEAGTPNLEGAIGLAAAIGYIQDIGIDAIHTYTNALRVLLEKQLRAIDGVAIYGMSVQKSPVTSFTMKNIHPHDIAAMLDKDTIAVRSGNHCAEVLVDSLGATAVVRASLHVYNNEEDIQKFLISLKNIQTFFHHA